MKILFCNAFLTAPWQWWSPFQSASFGAHGRAEKLASTFKNYDLTVLQECWGTGLTLIKSTATPGLWYTLGSMPLQFVPAHSRASYSFFYHWWNDFKDLWLLHRASTGGLACFGNSNVELLWHAKDTFTVSATKSRKGVSAHLIRYTPLDNKTSPICVALFNTHLDAFHHENKLRQVLQVRQFMVNSLRNDIIPRLGVQNLDESLIVLVAGDFNLKAHESQSYESLMDILSDSNPSTIRDLALELDSKENVNQSHTYDSKGNPLATYKKSSGRIDYVFAVDKIDNWIFRRVHVASFRLVKDTVVSDHWPLSLELRL